MLEKFLSGSIIKNLALVAASGILPVLLVIMASGIELRETKIAEAEIAALRMSENITDQQANITLAARQLLLTLSLIPEVRRMDAAACDAIFKEVIRQDPVNANITLLDAAGNVLASALPFSVANFADQKHVQDAISRKEFSPGEYLIGRVSAVPIIPFAFPVIDAGGQIIAILTTSLNLERYHALFDKSHLPRDSVLSIMDRNGRRLLYHPPSTSNPLGDMINPQAWEVYINKSSGIDKHSGMDGIRRIYAFHSLGMGPDTPSYLTIAIGIPEAQALASADAVTRQHLLWLGMAAILSLTLAWIVGRKGIVDRLSKLAAVASELGEGHLVARTGLKDMAGSLGTVAKAFDSMAEAIQVREMERNTTEESLRQSEDRYRTMVEAQTEFVSRFTPDGTYTFVNEAFCRFFGKSSEELIGSKWFPEASEEDLPMIQDKLASLAPENPVVLIENRVRDASGELHWVQFSNRAFFNRSGELEEIQSVGRDITERKLAEDQLAFNNVILQTQQEVSIDGILIVDSEGRILSYNQRFVEIWGIPSEVIESRSDEFALRAVLNKLANPEQFLEKVKYLYDYHLEKSWDEVVLADGRTLERYSAPMTGQEGAYHGRVWYFRDISERKQAEAALNESEEKFRSLFESMTEGVALHEIIYDSSGVATDYRIIDVNPSFEHFTGLSRSLSIGALATRLYGTGEAPFLDIYASVAANGTPAIFETFFPPMDKYFSLSVYSPSKGRFATILKDITERKQSMEIALRWQSLFENAEFGLAIVQPKDNTFIAVNNSYAQERGYTPEELAGKPVLLVYPSELHEEYVQIYRNIDVVGHGVFEMEHQRKDGSRFPVLFDVTVIKDEQGLPLSRVAYVLNITDRKQAEADLQKARETADAANMAKSEFLANMSHEIRTPLNGVLGMLQLMGSTALDEEQKEYLLNAIKSTNRLTRLLTDILDLSKIEAGKAAIREEVFEVSKQKESVLELFELAAREQEVELEFIISPDMPQMLVGDETRLRQLLFNLVGNAIKFAPKGHVTVEVLPIFFKSAAVFRTLFIVRDNGIGIPDDLLKIIFEPFTQAEGSYTRRFQGAGLGLSIVRKIVGLMGGELAIDSTVREGTTVYLSLPFKLSRDRQEQSEQTQGDTKKSIVPPLRVLLAEDDELSLFSCKRILEKSGYAVAVALDGQKALHLLGNQDFDLILMDVQMPVMDGVEATKRIRSGESGESNKTIPIIAMTAYAMNGDKEKFLDAGMDDYIAKPVEMVELDAVIRRVKDKR